MLLHFWFSHLLWFFWFSQLSAELWNGIYVKKKNFAIWEEAQEVKLLDPPQLSREHGAALKLLSGFFKKPMCQG